MTRNHEDKTKRGWTPEVWMAFVGLIVMAIGGAIEYGKVTQKVETLQQTNEKLEKSIDAQSSDVKALSGEFNEFKSAFSEFKGQIEALMNERVRDSGMRGLGREGRNSPIAHRSEETTNEDQP